MRLWWQWGLVLRGLCALVAVAQPARAQLFDTVEEPFVTKSDSVNERLRILKGFTVAIKEPELITNGGIRLRYGFDTWWLHVVAAKSIYIEGAPLDNRGELTYVALIVKAAPADAGEVDLEADSLVGRALFFKAIVAGENPEAKIDFYKSLAKKYDAAADSFTVLVDSLFMAEPWVPKRRDDYRLMAANCRFTADAYEAFVRAGDYGDDVGRFFLSHYLNFSDQVNIHTQPYGLPEILPTPKAAEPALAPKKKKRGFFRKLAFWK